MQLKIINNICLNSLFQPFKISWLAISSLLKIPRFFTLELKPGFAIKLHLHKTKFFAFAFTLTKVLMHIHGILQIIPTSTWIPVTDKLKTSFLLIRDHLELIQLKCIGKVQNNAKIFLAFLLFQENCIMFLLHIYQNRNSNSDVAPLV